MPSSSVSPSAITRPRRSFSSSEWCAQVTVQPDSSRIIVLSSGRWNGSNVSIPAGGHIAGPVASSTCSGNRAKWKNAQKNPTKNITSEVMNNVIP